MTRIVVTAKTICERDFLREHVAALAAGYDVMFLGADAPRDRHALARALTDAVAVIVGHETVDGAFLDGAPSIRVVGKYGVGMDNIDQDACAARGVSVAWRPGVNADAVAELALCFMIALTRRVVVSDRQMRDGLWRRDGGAEFRNKKVAIVGCGHVGSRVARLCRAFGARPLLCDIEDKSELAAELGAPLVSHERAWAEADIVTLHVPLDSGTRGMIDDRVLGVLPAGAYLVNTARGAVVDEDAMKRALRSGRLAGAALDVYAVEPPRDPELLTFPQLILTPHVAANAVETTRAMAGAAMEEVVCRLRANDNAGK